MHAGSTPARGTILIKNYHIMIRSLFLLLLILVGCKTAKVDNEKVIPFATLYKSGLTLLEQGKYKKSSEEFSKIFFQHPGSSLTPYAELMEAYSLYKDESYDDAIDVLDVFISLHPMHEDIAYAYYLKSLCFWNQISGVIYAQGESHEARNIIEELINRFPLSPYVDDSKIKLKLLYDQIAGQEMEIGRFYLNNKIPIAAILRFSTVIKQYPTTRHMPEALYRMVEGCLILGMKEEAQKYAQVLEANYKTNKWNVYLELKYKALTN